MNWLGCEVVESVNDRMGGVPVLRRSRMFADSIVENFDDGLSPEEIAEDFSLNLDDVKSLLDFAGRTHAVAMAS